jgi:hypothetical protein
MKYKEVSIKEANRNWLKVLRIAYNGDKKKHQKDMPQPVVITRFGRPYVIIQRFAEDVDKFEQLKAGKIDWETFKETMLQKGYEGIMSGTVRIRASDIVGAERVEVEKERAKIEGAAFMLDAAKYFSGRLYVCGHCGHKMIPATVEEENKYLDGGTIESTTVADGATPKPEGV